MEISLHAHSRFSAGDALPTPAQMVDRAVELGYKALALTDHGTVAGSVQLYRAARRAGIEPMPGIEAYLAEAPGSRNTYHVLLVSQSLAGYRNLCHLATRTAMGFRYKPLLTLEDLCQMADAGRTDGLLLLTGCWFGALQRTYRELGPHQAAHLLKGLDSVMPGKVYVELQQHMVVHDDGTDDIERVRDLVSLADEVGLPFVVTQDSHYLHRKDRGLHDTLKQLVSWSEDPADAVFPGSGYHMAGDDWMQQHFPEATLPGVLQRAYATMADILAGTEVRIPELESYRMRIPDVTPGLDPDDVLADRVAVEMGSRLIPRSRHQQYLERLAEELDVVRESRMAGYLLLVADLCDWMSHKGIWFGARGSASGSIVCWLLGITQADPIRYGLRFDRFLSRDRSKPPDVDLDVEHVRRSEVLDRLRSQYVVAHIGTSLQFSLTGGEEGVEEDTTSAAGSLRVRYLSTYRKRTGRKIDWADVPQREVERLRALSGLQLISGYGVHAAGLVVTDSEAELDQLPMTYIASSKTLVTSYGKDDVEALGFVKLDVLGLKTYTALRTTCEWASITDPEVIPRTDPQAMARIRKGNTTGLFQLEGWATQKGVKQLAPTRFADVVASMALFRPATLSSGATKTYIDRARKREKAPSYHPDIVAECAETHMVLLYQEQVIGVLRRIGMESEALNAMLKAVKASNAGVGDAAGVIKQHMPGIEGLAAARGWQASDVAWLTDAIEAFAGYSFNKAHATAYALMAWRSAWLATHHPVEFWAGLLSVWAGTPKEPIYRQAAKDNGVRVLSPHVNTSGTTYHPQDGKVYAGLLTITGVGAKAAAEIVRNRPYTSVTDLSRRVNPRVVTGAKHVALGGDPALAPGVMGQLHRFGALRGLPINELQLTDTEDE
jgi:DNA polymerase-3 subunit alpha